MRNSRPPDTLQCPTCARSYDVPPPAFCLTCGTRLEAAAGGQPPVASRARVSTGGRRWLWIAMLASVVVLLAIGGTLAAVFLTGNGGGVGPLPSTAAEMKESVRAAQDYLNSRWRNLAPMRTPGAPVYSVSARLDTGANTISGKARILFTNKAGAPLSEVVLRVYAASPVVNTAGTGAQVGSVTVDGKAVNATFKGSLLHVPLPDGLVPDGEVLLALDFSESIPEVSGGMGTIEQMLGQSSGGGYGVFGHSKNVYDLGYFIPTVTAYGPGGWEGREVPALGDMSDFGCAYYTVSIDAPAEYVVAAPGVATSAGASSGRKVHRFRGGPMRDFTAQASPDYQVARATEGETTVSSYYLKGAQKGKDALRFAQQAVKQYNSHIGYYPYVGLNVCEAPLGGGAGGMEFSGQVQIAEMLYGDLGKLLGSEGSTLNNLLNSLGGGLLGDMLEFTVAHEVCHQWWGLTVGSDSIAHPWQDESLTNYCTVLYFRWAHGEESAKQQLEMQVVLPYSTGKLLGGGGDMVVDTPASGFSNATQFSAIVYSKGALFFQALEKQLGADAFEQGLKKYYDDYAFRIATPQDLVASFSGGGGGDSVAALHRRWILETHADEDIAAGIPGMDMLDQLLKDLPGGLDMNNLEELLKEFMPNGSLPQLPDDMQLDDQEPILPI